MNIKETIEKIAQRCGVRTADAERTLIMLVQGRFVRSTGCSERWGNERCDIWQCWQFRNHQFVPTTYNDQANSIENITCGKVTDVEINDADFEDWLQSQPIIEPKSISTPTSAKDAPRKRPGPPPETMKRLIKQMRETQPEKLDSMLVVEMEATFHASHAYVIKARKIVQSERVTVPHHKPSEQ